MATWRALRQGPGEGWWKRDERLPGVWFIITYSFTSHDHCIFAIVTYPHFYLRNNVWFQITRSLWHIAYNVWIMDTGVPFKFIGKYSPVCTCLRCVCVGGGGGGGNPEQ